MSKYADIIERLEKATGPRGEIDYAIRNIVEGYDRTEGASHSYGFKEWAWKGNECFELDAACPQFTTSIDAAIALVERMLPGWSWLVRDDSEGAFCNISSPGLRDNLAAEWIDGETCFPSWAKTAPIAILLSLFRALEAKEDVA